MSYGFTTSVSNIGEDGLPDYIYYNFDIINNRTSDLNQAGLAAPDPPIRFNETRDAPLVKDSSKYHFSIIRFTMNGANRDLPLFIPNIQTGQIDPDLTTYKVAIAYQQSWNLADGSTYSPTVIPLPSTVVYSTEWTNEVLAPKPQAPFNQQDLTSRYYWVTTYNQALTWFNSALVGAHNTGVSSAATPANPSEGTYKQFQDKWAADNGSLAEFPYPTFTDFQNDVNTPQITFNNNKKFSIWGDSDGFGQRIVPFTAVTNQRAWNGTSTYPANAYVYNGGFWWQNTSGAPITGGTSPSGGGVGWTSLGAGVPPNFAAPATPATSPQLRLFFNTNMYGLFANFPVEYYNRTDLTGFNLPSPTTAFTAPAGYTFEVLFINKFFQNLVDYRLAPYAGTPPLGLVPVTNQAVYYVMEQDYQSIDSIWSPISSIVFTTTLLPVKTEATGQPLVLGESNIGNSTATTQNAFQPIITDIALDQQLDGADDYRQFIYYAPSAEYRMSDFTASKQDIRNIDIQVFWKNRLDSQLIPINMFNLSSVSLKMMFRHKRVSV